MAHSHDRKQQVEQQLEQHVLPLAVERAIVLIGERGEQEARAQLAGETAWVVREQPFIPPELQPYAEQIVQTVAGRVVDRAMEQATQRIRMPPAPAWSPQPVTGPPGGPPPGNVAARALDATPPPEPVHGWSPQPQQQPMPMPMPVQPPMPMPQRPGGGGKGLLIALLVVMVLGAGGFAVWFFGFRDAGTEEGEGPEEAAAASEADEADETAGAKAEEKKDEVVAGGKTVAPAASGTETAMAQAPVDAAVVAEEAVDAGPASATTPTTTTTTTTTSAEEEPFVGSWTISSAKTLAGAAYTGKVVIAKQGDVYQVSWTTSGGSYQGIGLRAGVDQLYVAWGPGEVALGVYELRGTELTGRWAMPGGAALGTEKSAKEARKLAARHKTVGALPTGEAYQGELALKDKGATWDVSWYVEKKKMEGIAIPGTGRELESDSFPIIGVAYGKGAGIVRYQMHGEGELRGVWCLPRQRALATEDLIR